MATESATTSAAQLTRHNVLRLRERDRECDLSHRCANVWARANILRTNGMMTGPSSMRGHYCRAIIQSKCRILHAVDPIAPLPVRAVRHCVNDRAKILSTRNTTSESFPGASARTSRCPGSALSRDWTG